MVTFNIEYKAISDRIITVKFNSTSNKLNIIQVNAPKTASDEEETDDFYNSLAEVISLLPKAN